MATTRSFGAIDLPHSARADQRDHGVRPRASPGRERHDVLNNFTPPEPIPDLIRRETLPALNKDGRGPSRSSRFYDRTQPLASNETLISPLPNPPLKRPLR